MAMPMTSMHSFSYSLAGPGPNSYDDFFVWRAISNSGIANPHQVYADYEAIKKSHTTDAAMKILVEQLQR